MGKVSDMAMDQQQEGVDELLCEIDHFKELLDEACDLIHDFIPTKHDDHDTRWDEWSGDITLKEGEYSSIIEAEDILRAFLHKVRGSKS